VEKQTRSEKEMFYAALEQADSRKQRELLDRLNRTLRRDVERLLTAHAGDMVQVCSDAEAASDEVVGPIFTWGSRRSLQVLEKIGESRHGC
jgi:hypothetical protein